MNQGSPSGSRDGTLDALVESFLDRHRRGEAPRLADYLEGHPEHADELREILPALVALERIDARTRADGEALAGGAGGARSLHAPGVRLGPYRIVREIGRGGMGTVFEAHQEPLGRRVALKVLSSQRLTPPDVERFRREAELASRLDHPAICTVYDSGVEDEISYIAMRYVEGETLAQRIENTRKQAGTSTSTAVWLGEPASRGGSSGTERAPSSDVRRARDDITRVVRLVETIARGLHAAHEVGIIHRDVKPGNVMVTPEGEPVLLDFGLARDLESVQSAQSALTRTGDLCGTPAYMSPEQISGRTGDLDRQTDVYSLGVSLFQCLTLRLPFEAPTREALYRAILAHEPSNSRALNALVPADLKAVIETALEKDRNRRYRSAADMADDLRRFLELRPVLARPVGLVRRTARAARRNPGMSVAIGMFLCLFVGVPTLVAWQQHAANETLLVQKNRADAEGQRAYLNYREARNAVDKIVLAAAEDRLRDVPQAEPLRRELLEAGLAFYQRVQQANSLDPKVRLETAIAGQRIGHIQAGLGQEAVAADTFGRAITEMDALVAEDPACDEARLGRARCLLERAAAVDVLGRFADAEADLMRADEDLRSTPMREASAPARALAIAQTERQLGLIRKTAGRPAQAEQDLRSALAIVRSLAPGDRYVVEARRTDARISTELGELLTELGELAEAEVHLLDGLAAQERLVAEFPGRAELGRELYDTRIALASLWAASGRTLEAEQEYTRTIADQERQVAAHPSLVEQRRLLSQMYSNLAGLWSSLGRNDEAEASGLRAVELMRGLVRDFPEVPDDQNTLAASIGNLAYAIQGTKPAEAEALDREAIRISTQLVAEHPEPAFYQDVLATNINCLGVLCQLDRTAEAESLYRRNLQINRALHERFPAQPGYASDLGGNLHNLARMLIRRGEREEARHLFDEAICLQSDALAANPRSPIYRESLSEHLESAAKNLIELKLVDPAARMAAQLPQWFPDSAFDQVIAASLFARCAAAAESDEHLSAAERESLSTRRADDALVCLRQAVRLGFRDRDALERDDAFAAVRKRADYRELLAQWPANKAGKQH